MSTEKKTSRRKKAEEPITAAPEVAEEAAAPAPKKKKAPARKAAPAKKAAARKTTAKPVAEPAIEPIEAIEANAAPAEPVEIAAPKPARKAAPRKKTAADKPAAASPPSAPVATGLALQRGLESRLQWQAGDGCPPELAELAATALDAESSLPAEAAHDFVAALVEKARALGHPLDIEPGIWMQLALRRDAEGRVRRLEQLLTEGVDALSGCLPHQLEAALFAVSAGRALLADDLGVGQREAAIAALQLWRQGFGLDKLVVLAPVARHAAWSAALPEGVRLASDPEALAGQQLDVLLVDAIETWEIDRLRGLACTHLHLLANSEPLRDARLAAWIDWLDDARRGPVARLAALPPEAGARERRDALQTLLLSRRKRELADRLPERLDMTLELSVSPPMPEAPLACLRAASERWTRVRFAAQAERIEVLAALHALRDAELDPNLLQAQAAALKSLADEWAPLKLKLAGEPAKLAALAARLADRPELLAPAGEATAIVHLDLPWSAAALEARHEGLPEGGLPVAWLLPAHGHSAALRKAPLPLDLDAAPPWWPDADWAALMDGLPALLDW